MNAPLDLLIRGGTVVDGTGAPGETADVGVRDGKIAAVGRIDDEARETIDADGLRSRPGSSTFTRTTTRSSTGTRPPRRRRGTG